MKKVIFFLLLISFLAIYILNREENLSQRAPASEMLSKVKEACDESIKQNVSNDICNSYSNLESEAKKNIDIYIIKNENIPESLKNVSAVIAKILSERKISIQYNTSFGTPEISIINEKEPIVNLLYSNSF